MTSLRRAWIAAVLVACTGGEASPAAPRAREAVDPAAAEPTVLPTEAPADEPEPAPPASKQPAGPVAKPARPGACASGDACMDAARLAHRAGRRREAAHAFERGCELGSVASCYALGRAYRDGDGVAVDEGRAEELFRDACAAGSAAACDALGH